MRIKYRKFVSSLCNHTIPYTLLATKTENNPWNLEGTEIPQYQPNASLVERFREHDAVFSEKHPLLCSVPNQQLFIEAMQSGIHGSNAAQLSDEIMTLAKT